MDDLDDKTGSEWLYISEPAERSSNMKKDQRTLRAI